MKTLNIFLLVALISLTFTSCSDNGPVSIKDKDGLDILKNTSEESTFTVTSSSTSGSDISSDVTTLPDPDTEVLDFGMVPLDANTTEIAGCAYVYKLDKQVPPDAEVTIPAPDGFSGDITFKVTGNKVDGYNIEVTDDVSGYFAFIDEVYFGIGNNARKFTFNPGITYAGPLPAPINPSGEAGDISHVHFCYDLEEFGRSLDVSKTVVTAYTRTHKWDIEKKAETEYGHELDGYPKVWLYIDGTGDEKATWTVDVTYDNYEDSGHNVSGVITIENIGTSTKSIESIDDVLAGTLIYVDCGASFELPYSLPVGETLTCTYDEDVASKIQGDNVLTVTAEGEEDDPYEATEPIMWGDPTTEINETVNVKDISDLLGEVSLGSVTAPNGDTFTYDKEFAWADYGEDDCGNFMYDNTASIVETGQSDDASLKVNVQCYVYESAWAKGDKPVAADEVESFCDNGFNNWGWTNKIRTGSFEWDLWAGAGQCDTSKGTLVGTVVVAYNGGIDVQFNIDPDLILKETHVYAGTDMFPQGAGRVGGNTTAPGQYYIQDPLTGDIWVIAHGVVGLPDPDFGPAE